LLRGSSLSICKFATNIVDKWKTFQFLVMFVRTNFILDGLLKIQYRPLFVIPTMFIVIPAQAGIQ